ncbi:MAG TPA: dihydrolipoamide acetyltransferase family protein [Anaerolineales bacterium]|nr:dihydrolipoamide acetyltransferase family protein [Anaerolineales bacterium]
MPTKVIMPQLGESVDEATISKWLVEEGQQVDEYDPLLEVNTDKVDSEIPSPAAGTVLEIVVPEGSTVHAGSLLAWIGKPEERIPEGKGSGGIEAESAVKEEIAVAEVEKEAGAPIQAPRAAEAAIEAAAPGRDRNLGFISPVVSKIASEHNVDLTRVQGTGSGGRITKKDILAYIKQREKVPKTAPAVPARKVTLTAAEEAAPPAGPTPLLASTPGEIIPHTIMRRRIAEHMVQSKRTSAHVTTVMEADMSAVIGHRQTHKEAFARDGVNLTFTAYFTAATVAGLRAHPIVNSSWSEEGIVIHREINIGLAVSLGEEGLIVPVVKNADRLSLLGLARTINDLSNRARARQLNPDEVQGGTFTITNHGTSGSLFASPIINQPQCAILGVGAIQKRVVVINDAIAIRPMVYISLTFDHRILDGAIADYFLGKVVESLENWQ